MILDYHKKDGVLHNLQKYAKKNKPLIVFGYLVVFLFDYYTEKIPFLTLGTLFFLMGWTYFSHIIAHTKFMEGNIHKFHHDPAKSTQNGYRVLEFLVDIFIFGGLVLVPLNYGIEKLMGSHWRCFNYYGILFWSLLYATYHLNWHFITYTSPHSFHHEDARYNFGPDILDILFETKKDEDIIENMNYALINIFFIFVMFVIMHKLFLPYYITNGTFSSNVDKTI